MKNKTDKLSSLISRAFDCDSQETIVNRVEICLRFARMKKSSVDKN